MMQLTLANGAKLAIDPDTIAAVEEHLEEGKPSAAIVYAGNHRFVTANVFESVYEEWLSFLDADPGDGDGEATEATAAAHYDGGGSETVTG